MYKIILISATSLLLATPVLADWPDGANDNYGDNQGSPSQMSDKDFQDALREGGDVGMGLEAGGKDASQGSAGKGSFGSDAGDND